MARPVCHALRGHLVTPPMPQSCNVFLSWNCNAPICALREQIQWLKTKISSENSHKPTLKEYEMQLMECTKNLHTNASTQRPFSCLVQERNDPSWELFVLSWIKFIGLVNQLGCVSPWKNARTHKWKSSFVLSAEQECSQFSHTFSRIIRIVKQHRGGLLEWKCL